MVYGNHDIIKRDPKYVKTKCHSFYCDSTNENLELFPEIKILDGLILQYRDTDNRLFLTHGHQADYLNDTFWRFSRFMVRYVWKPLELLGVKDPTSAAKSHHKKNKIEKRLVEWSKENNRILICGHTHRPVYPKPNEPLYFNDGSCVHPRCITGLEIRNGTICLVKWATMTRPDRTLFVNRVVLEGPIRLAEYFDAVKSKEKI